MQVRRYESNVEKEEIFKTLLNIPYVTEKKRSNEQVNERNINIKYFTTAGFLQYFYIQFTDEKNFTIRSKTDGVVSVLSGIGILCSILSVLTLIIAISLPMEIKHVIASLVGGLVGLLMWWVGRVFNNHFWRKIEKPLLDNNQCQRIDKNV